MDQDPFEKVRLALPPHLAAETKQELLAQLQRHVHDNNFDYYGHIPGETEPVQGDAWRGLTAVDYDTLERHKVVGFVISNSCDIALGNRPEPDQNLLFAPIIDLDRYAQQLQEVGRTPAQVEDLLAAIRRQAVHRIFYLPPVPGVQGESLVLLDDLCAQPLRTVNPSEIQRLFTLNNFGWYILLVKLSIHFLRMQEGLNRQNAHTAQ